MGIVLKFWAAGVVALSFGAGLFTGLYLNGSRESRKDFSQAERLESSFESAVPHRQNPVVPNTTKSLREPSSRLASSLVEGPGAIKDALDYLSTPDEMRKEVAKLYDEAAYAARSTGDFGQLANLFTALSQSDRHLLGHQLPTIFSKLGPTHDISEKLAILDKISIPRAAFEEIRRRIYQMEAMERYDDMKREGIVGKLPTGDFVDVCSELGKARLGKAFERVADGGTEETQRAAAAALGVYAMQAGTMNGSKIISELPPGIIRDEAVAELVSWLKRTGSKQEAQPWLDTIMDAKARERAAR